MDPLKLLAGNAYLIDLESTAFDAYLILQDSGGNVVAENDNIRPGDRNSRIFVGANHADVCRLIATSSGRRGFGAYTLRVHEFTAPGPADNQPSPPR
jgi:serine protease Do